MHLTLTRANGEVVCTRCVVADDPIKRAKGLFGRGPLEPGEGMFFASSTILTSFTRVPVDAVFVDEDFTIVDVRPDVKPWRFATCRGARGVIELPAGLSAQLGLRRGEHLSTGAAGVNGNGESAANGGHRIRVLLATPDTRFAKVAQFLLARHGFTVETHRGLDRVVAAARAGNVDVVLLDASGGIAAAARVTRALAALDGDGATAGVVVVADEETNGNGAARSAALDVLPKWTSFEHVVAAVRDVHRRETLLELD